VAEILAAQSGMASLKPGHVLARLRYQAGIEDIPENNKAIAGRIAARLLARSLSSTGPFRGWCFTC